MVLSTFIYFFIFKKCSENCEIVIVVIPNYECGFLVHNEDGRYERDVDIPIKEGTMVFSEKVFQTPLRCRHSANVELFQGDDGPPTIHALAWLRLKRGVQCNKAGGYIGEYNLRHAPNV